uniref:Replicase n=1 Tax=Garlic latent virus TaxID=12458 RepID=A0A6M2YVF0_9VIRU|nr:replicase [Garlic latent virus]QED43599.1 replicase [Garlic latent virus]QED43605.1 replicase [Garlic latent virus]QED43611.1 replicase [Garlic latent virus]
MALTYRSPVEEVLTSFTTSEQSEIARGAVQGLLKLEEFNHNLFNFALSPIAKQRLCGSGIYLSPFSYVPHSHPACKTLENYNLYQVVCPLIDHRFYLVGIKQSKLCFLKSRNRKMDIVECINRMVTSRDKLRYGSDFVVQSGQSGTVKKSSNTVTFYPELASLVPHEIKFRSRSLFLHDELHYWSKESLAIFLDQCSPELMLATVVIPPELLLKAKESMNKWCYEFEVKGPDLFFYPDGVRAEGYIQPARCTYLLTTNKIITPGGQVYCLDIISSKFAHHVIAITRGEALVKKENSFSNFEAIGSSYASKLLHDDYPCFPISYEVVMKLYTYLSSLNSPDVKSAVAKLRQLVEHPTAFEVQFTIEFANLYIRCGVNLDIFTPSTKNLLLKSLSVLMPALLTKYSKKLMRVSFTGFVSNLKPLSFNVKCETLDFKMPAKHPHGSPLPTVDKFLTSCLELGETLFKNDMIEREPAPYNMISNEETHLHSDPEELLRRNFKYLGDLEGFTYSSTAQVLIGAAEVFRPLYLYLFNSLGEQCVDHCLIEATMAQRKERAKSSEQKLFALPWYSNGTNESSGMYPAPPFNCLEHEDENWGAAGANDDVEPMLLNLFNCVCGTGLQWTIAFHVELLNVSMSDRLHNRRAAFYSKGGFGYSYNGGCHSGLEWLDEFDSFLAINGHDLEYFNCVLFQEYDGGHGIGFHSDDEAIFEKNSKILTVCIRGDCEFRFRCAAGETGFFMEAPKQFMMPEGFQGSHRHAVRGCTPGRISATFRRAKVPPFETKEASEVNCDELGNSTDDDSEMGCLSFIDNLGVSHTIQKTVNISPFVVREVSGSNNMCFWNCLSFLLNLDAQLLKDSLSRGLEKLRGASIHASLTKQLAPGAMAEDDVISLSCQIFSLEIVVHSLSLGCTTTFAAEDANKRIDILHNNEHFSLLFYKNDCFVSAVSQTFSRDTNEMYRVLADKKFDELTELLRLGCGLTPEDLEVGFRLLNIKAHVNKDGEFFLINETGEINGFYSLTEDHLVACPPFSKNLFATKTILNSNEHLAVTAIKMLREVGSELIYKASLDRASNFERSLLKGCTGIRSSTLFAGFSSRLKEEHMDHERPLTTVLGTFGAGKTSLIKRAVVNFKKSGRVVHFVSPRRSLADALIQSLGLTENGAPGADCKSKSKRKSKKNSQNTFVRTFETFLIQNARVGGNDLVFFDEIQLFPPGYLDYASMLLPMTTQFFILGDPLQSDYDSMNDRHVFLGYEGDIFNLLKGSEYKYNILSRRFSNSMFASRLPCAFNTEGFTTDEPYIMLQGLSANVDEIKNFSEVYLVASFVEKNFVKAHLGENVKVLTFGESTGLTFEKGAVFITENALKTSECRWVTALSRFSRNLILINMLEITFEALASQRSTTVLGRFLKGSAEPSNTLEKLPGKPVAQYGFTQCVGKNFGVREAKLQGDPWLKSEIFLGQEDEMQEIEEVAEIVQKEVFKTHLPRCDLEGLRTQWNDKILLKEAREFKFRNLVTDQFTDCHSKQKGKILTNQAERFETIYPRHRANDTLTFLMAVKKRLRFSKPHLECAKMKEAEPYGKFLLNEFLKRVPLKPHHRHDLMAAALHDFEEKKVSKSAAIIENHANRSCSDWLADVGLVFSKSQICTKWDNRFRSAKAAQTIVCFQHSVLIRFAPYMRYIEKKVLEVLPKKYYIHSGKGLDELNQWVCDNKFNSTCTESDYEAFDASQDQYIMAFEIALMEYLGLPKSLIKDYKYIKTHLGCKMGALAIMRFSGEASTFLFNTLANMLFTFLRYDLNGQESICFAGDDMCANRRLRVSLKHEDFLGKLKLKAKVAFTRRPTFCGWNLTFFGIYKKPQLVFERMCIAKETNNLHNCIDNYAIEISFAYIKGELAVCHMDKDELDAFYNCVRVVVKSRHLLKSNVRDLFKNEVET